LPTLRDGPSGLLRVRWGSDAQALADRVSQSFKTHAFARRRLAIMPYTPVSFAQKFGLFTEQWQPKVVAEM